MPLVLVIDDEPQMRVLMRRVLEAAGHKVIEAENGDSGIKQLGSSRPDVVICDILMPVKEGVATISEIRRMLPHVKIIAISGGGAIHNMRFLEAAQKYGADAVLPKPFRAAELAASVNGLLARV